MELKIVPEGIVSVHWLREKENADSKKFSSIVNHRRGVHSVVGLILTIYLIMFLYSAPTANEVQSKYTYVYVQQRSGISPLS